MKRLRDVVVWGALAAAFAASANAEEGRTVKGQVSVPEGGDATAAVVYVDAVIGKPTAAKVVVKLDHEVFSPPVVALARGSAVTFENADEVIHNPFSSSPGNRFDLGVMKPGASASVTLQTSGAVEIRCLVQPKMVGYALVAPSNYFSRVDKQGSFSVGGIPPGRYKLRAWHPMYEPVETWVNLDEAKLITVSLQFRK